MATLAELIAEHCNDFGQDYPAIADCLNEPTVVANPDAGKITTTVVPHHITLKDVMAIVPATEMAAAYKEFSSFTGDLRKAIDDQDRDYMGGLLLIAVTGAVISPQTAGQLQALLVATDTSETVAPDTLPGPSVAEAAGLGVITAMQVQAALN